MSTPDSTADELRAIRSSIERLSDRVDRLATENATLRGRLDASEAARTDLVAQAEHLIHLLDVSRKELRKLQGEG